MSRNSLVDQLIEDRRFEECRQNIQDALSAMSSEARFRRVAVHAYVSLTEIWKLTDSDAARLLGISISDYKAWQKGKSTNLRTDELEKISCLMGVYKYLMTLYSGKIDRVSAWLLRLNSGDIYQGKSPYSFLAGASVELFYVARRDLAAATV